MTVTSARVGHNRRIYLSTTKEATYDAGGTTVNMVINPLSGSGDYIQVSELTTTDADTATGYEAATQDIHLGVELPETSVDCRASAELVGCIGAFLLGDDTHSGTGNITHTITPISLAAAGGFPGSTEIEEHRAGATATGFDTRVTGVYFTSMTLSGSNTGLVDCSFSFRGSGGLASTTSPDETTMIQPSRVSGIFPSQSVTVGLRTLDAEHDPAAHTFVPATAAFTASNVVTGGSPAWVPFQEQLRSWTITITNEIAEDSVRATGTASATGLFGCQPIVVRRTVTASLTFLDSTAFDEYQTALFSGSTTNNVERSLGIEMVNDKDVNTADYAQVFVHIPVVRMVNVAKGSFGETNTLTLELEGKSSMGAEGYPLVRLFTQDAQNAAYNQ